MAMPNNDNRHVNSAVNSASCVGGVNRRGWSACIAMTAPRRTPSIEHVERNISVAGSAAHSRRQKERLAEARFEEEAAGLDTDDRIALRCALGMSRPNSGDSVCVKPEVGQSDATSLNDESLDVALEDQSSRSDASDSDSIMDLTASQQDVVDQLDECDRSDMRKALKMSREAGNTGVMASTRNTGSGTGF